MPTPSTPKVKSLDLRVKRVRLSKAPIMVHARTAASLRAWRALYGLPLGRSIDALFQFSMERLEFKLPLTGARNSLKRATVDKAPAKADKWP